MSACLALIILQINPPRQKTPPIPKKKLKLRTVEFSVVYESACRGLGEGCREAFPLRCDATTEIVFDRRKWTFSKQKLNLNFSVYVSVFSRKRSCWKENIVLVQIRSLELSTKLLFFKAKAWLFEPCTAMKVNDGIHEWTPRMTNSSEQDCTHQSPLPALHIN